MDHLTDVYALGVIFYEMLTGKAFVEGENITNILFNVLHKKTPLLRSANNNFSKDLEAICYKAVAKETQKRYQSATEFSKDIEKFLCGEFIVAKTVSLWQKIQGTSYKSKLILLIVVVNIVLLFVGIWLFEKRYSKEAFLLVKKAKKWQQQANNVAIDKQMEIYINISNILEKALTISPNNRIVKNKLIKTQVKIALLAKKQKNYLLSFALLQQSKRLGYKQAFILLGQLEQEKKKQQKKHRQLVAKIMDKTLQGVQKDLVDRYVFSIVKIQRPYVVGILVPYLTSSNKMQRLLATKALGKLGNTYTRYKEKDSIQYLLGNLEKFKNKESIFNNQKEVEAIIWALGWLKDKRASYPVYRLRKFIGENNVLWGRTRIPSKWIPLQEKFLQTNTVEQFIVRGNIKGREKKVLQWIWEYGNWPDAQELAELLEIQSQTLELKKAAAMQWKKRHKNVWKDFQKQLQQKIAELALLKEDQQQEIQYFKEFSL